MFAPPFPCPVTVSFEVFRVVFSPFPAVFAIPDLLAFLPGAVSLVPGIVRVRGELLVAVRTGALLHVVPSFRRRTVDGADRTRKQENQFGATTIGSLLIPEISPETIIIGVARPLAGAATQSSAFMTFEGMSFNDVMQAIMATMESSRSQYEGITMLTGTIYAESARISKDLYDHSSGKVMTPVWKLTRRSEQSALLGGTSLQTRIMQISDLERQVSVRAHDKTRAGIDYMTDRLPLIGSQFVKLTSNGKRNGPGE